jgi:hypothetical protein
MGNVFFIAPAGMIGVTVRNNGFIYRFPGIEVNIGSLAVNPFLIEDE